MTTSDVIKDLINRTFGAAEWKRRSKAKINNLYELREFEEPKSGIVVQAFTNVESQHTFLYNGSKIIFGVSQDEEELVVVFAEPFAFKNEELDGKLGDIFPYIGKTPPSYLIKGENPLFWFCDVGLHSRDQLIADLVSGGFTFDMELANHLNEDFGGPVYGLPSLGAVMAANAPAAEDFDDEENPFGNEPIVFAIYDSKTAKTQPGEGMTVHFNPKSYWDNEQCLYDSHVHDFLSARGITLPNYLPGEDMENTFSVWEPWMLMSHSTSGVDYPKFITKAQIVADLSQIPGLVFDQAFDDFMNG